jgi:hypothetical protein
LRRRHISPAAAAFDSASEGSEIRAFDVNETFAHRSAPVTRTTRDLKVEIARLNRLIARIEAKPHREWAMWSSTLHDLVEEREVLGTLMRNRRIEASKKVVSFQRWRDGPWAA